MNKSISYILFLGLLLGVACGKKESASTPNESIESKALCLKAEVFNPSFKADYQVALSRKLILKVLKDIGSKPGTSVQDFWSNLNESTREELNFELNLILHRKKTFDPKLILRGTAVFFSRVLGSFEDDYEYRIKETGGLVIGFRAREKRTRFIQNLATTKCAGDATTELSLIKVPASVINEIEVRQLIKCRSLRESFSVMEARNSILLSIDGKIHKTLSTNLSQSANLRRHSLNIKSKDFKLHLRIRLNEKMEARDIRGYKSYINLDLPDLNIQNEGVCEILKSTL